MSNHSSAYASADSMSPATRKPARSLWRRFFDAWVRSYQNRLDQNGNIVMCEFYETSLKYVVPGLGGPLGGDPSCKRLDGARRAWVPACAGTTGKSGDDGLKRE